MSQRPLSLFIILGLRMKFFHNFCIYYFLLNNLIELVLLERYIFE